MTWRDYRRRLQWLEEAALLGHIAKARGAEFKIAAYICMS